MASWVWQARTSEQVTGDRLWPVTDQNREAQRRRTGKKITQRVLEDPSHGYPNRDKKDGEKESFWRKDQKGLGNGFHPNANGSVFKMEKDLKRLEKVIQTRPKSFSS